MHTALQGSHGPGAETSVLLLQVKLRKPRARVQRELKEKETEDLKQQIRTYSTLLRSVTHWAGEVKAYQKSDVYLSSVRVASKTLLSIASFDLAAVLRGGHDRNSYSHITDERKQAQEKTVSALAKSSPNKAGDKARTKAQGF